MVFRSISASALSLEFTTLLPFPNGPTVGTVGGFVEPYAFGGKGRSSLGLPAHNTSGLVHMAGPEVPYGLANATFASSWVLGLAAASEEHDPISLDFPHFFTRELSARDAALHARVLLGPHC